MVYLQELKNSESQISHFEIESKNVCLIGMSEPLVVLQNPLLSTTKKLVIYTANFSKNESDFIKILRKINPEVEIHLVLKTNFTIDLRGLCIDYITDDRRYLQDIFNDADAWEVVNNSNEPIQKVKKEDIIHVKFQKKTLSVFQLLLDGYRYDEIAEKLEISIDSVRFSVKKIYTATGVNSKSELMAKYHQGLLELDK
jgi:DNA-binding CsgD family transcriptional regulator